MCLLTALRTCLCTHPRLCVNLRLSVLGDVCQRSVLKHSAAWDSGTCVCPPLPAGTRVHVCGGAQRQLLGRLLP